MKISSRFTALPFAAAVAAACLSTSSPAQVPAVDPVKVEKQQLELQKQQLELERKQLELERKHLELERSLVPGATEAEAEAIFKVKLEGEMLFDFEKTELKTGADKVLSTVIAILSIFPTGKVFIDGHTDSKGKENVNVEFSMRRAEAVKRYLVKQGGVPTEQITTRGLGETQPIAANENADGTDNPEGRALNRRVEITVTR